MKCDIKIKSPTYPINAELVIAQEAEGTILLLKGKIRDRLGNEALVESTQKLIYGGHVLEDHKTLTDLNIPASATFHLVTPPHVMPKVENTSLPLESQSATSAGPSSVTSTTEPPSSLSTTTATSQMDQGLVQEGNDSSETMTEESNPTSDVPQAAATESHSPDLSSFAAETHSFLGRHERIEHTGVNYALCYVEGFPYLIKTRHLRRSRRQAPSGSSRQSGGSSSSSIATNNVSSNDSNVRQRHVDLPATAAIPVRTAEGRRALILSPEGVRAMAAQGVNVETGANSRAGASGINYVTLRRYVSAGVPHGWLLLKLVFLVIMLGSNATWTRFMILNFIAFGIFLWQSGILGRTLARPQAAAGPNNQQPMPNAVRPQPVQPVARAVAAQLGAGNLSTQGITPQSAASPTFLQSFTNSFISSIVPRQSNQRVPGHHAANVQREDLQNTANDPTPATDSASVQDNPAAASRIAAEGSENHNAGTNTPERHLDEDDHEAAILRDAMRQDW